MFAGALAWSVPSSGAAAFKYHKYLADFSGSASFLVNQQRVNGPNAGYVPDETTDSTLKVDYQWAIRTLTKVRVYPDGAFGIAHQSTTLSVSGSYSDIVEDSAFGESQTVCSYQQVPARDVPKGGAQPYKRTGVTGGQFVAEANAACSSSGNSPPGGQPTGLHNPLADMSLTSSGWCSPPNDPSFANDRDWNTLVTNLEIYAHSKHKSAKKTYTVNQSVSCHAALGDPSQGSQQDQDGSAARTARAVLRVYRLS
jgi:hypothetical protein